MYLKFEVMPMLHHLIPRLFLIEESHTTHMPLQQILTTLTLTR